MSTNKTKGNESNESNGNGIDAKVREAVKAAVAEMRGAFLERDAEVEAIMLAALAQEHIVLLGRAGTGKSELLRRLAQVFGLKGAEYFEICMSKFTTPEAFLGPYKLTALQQDRYERNTENRMPECVLAMFDEIFKANAPSLHTLLPAMNEGIMEDGGKIKKLPLRMLVGASNEMPEDDSLHALWDRFLFRTVVKPLEAKEARMELLRRASGAEAKAGACSTVQQHLTLEDWDTAVTDVRKVTLGPDANEALCQLRDLLEKEGVVHGDRRWVKVVRALQAKAYIDGDAEIDEEHFCILSTVLWDEKDHIPVIEKLTKAVANPLVQEVERIVEAALAEADRLVNTGSSEEMFRALNVLKGAGKKVAQRRDAASGKTHKRIDTKLNSLRADFATLKETVKQKHAELFGADEGI